MFWALVRNFDLCKCAKATMSSAPTMLNRPDAFLSFNAMRRAIFLLSGWRLGVYFSRAFVAARPCLRGISPKFPFGLFGPAPGNPQNQ